MKTIDKHTPRPWRVVEASLDGCPGAWDVWSAYDPTPGSRNNYSIAIGIQSREEAELIAAAPRLLAACESAADWMCDCTPGTDQWERGIELRKVITQARGGNE